MATTPSIISERLAELATIVLDSGAHNDFDDGVCAMELVGWLAGEPWSDHPSCTCPVIATFVRSWNDNLPDDDRTRLLLPIIPRLVGTISTKAVEDRRSMMAADWLVRVQTPAWLRLAGMDAHANRIEALPEITSMAQLPSMRGPIEAARKDADAARAAARDAAWDAAREAARNAARDAARAALKPTVEHLQISTIALVNRMIEAKEAA